MQFYDAGSDGAATDTAAAGAVADGKPLDLSDAIANEVAELKEHSNDIFTFHQTNVNGLLYVSMAASAGRQLWYPYALADSPQQTACLSLCNASNSHVHPRPALQANCLLHAICC